MRHPATALRFKRLLLKWYRAHARRLPWRETRDSYRVLVSEFMLQQTQVSRVLEYYPRFLARFPTLEHLARARPRAVREAWDGLGYYARAANLHALARTVVRDGGTIPGDPDRLRRLPGVGRYTAGAVASFAYQRRAAAVDTNVKRVLRRVYWADRRTGGPADREIWGLATRLLPGRSRVVWEFNQALMELGARICVARTPRCHECPVRAVCRTGSRMTG
jgi:A/G-specific adenine glycosylase